MDNAIWATWYDLEPSTEAEHLDWLRNDYLPRLRKRSGYMWVALYKRKGGGPDMDIVYNRLHYSDDKDSQGGSAYIVIAGAGSAFTFFKPSAFELEDNATGTDRRMFDQRIGSQRFVFSEYARVNGPEYAKRTPGTVPGPGIQFGSLRCSSLEGEHYAGRWYAEYRLPHMTTTPGCISARTYLANYGWSKFGVLYEFTSLQARLDNFEPHETLADREEKSQWVGHMGQYARPVAGSPVVAERLWPEDD